MQLITRIMNRDPTDDELYRGQPPLWQARHNVPGGMLHRYDVAVSTLCVPCATRANSKGTRLQSCQQVDEHVEGGRHLRKVEEYEEMHGDDDGDDEGDEGDWIENSDGDWGPPGGKRDWRDDDEDDPPAPCLQTTAAAQQQQPIVI